MGAAVRLTISMEAAAALAAHVRVSAEGLEIDPQVRSGGHPWLPEELIALLGAHGLGDAHEVPRTWAAPVRLDAAQRP